MICVEEPTSQTFYFPLELLNPAEPSTVVYCAHKLILELDCQDLGTVCNHDPSTTTSTKSNSSSAVDFITSILFQYKYVYSWIGPIEIFSYSSHPPAASWNRNINVNINAVNVDANNKTQPAIGAGRCRCQHHPEQQI